MLVKGFENYSVTEDGTVTNVTTGRVLKPDVIWDGYERVTLCCKGVTKRFRVHRLVAECFIPNPDNLPIINHLDGDRRNNHVSNLAWSTSKTNRNHGYVPKGSEISWTKLNEETVRKVCGLIQDGLPRGRILERVPDINKTQFDDIRRRRSWKHVSIDYNWT